MKLGKMFPSKYLKADDLENKKLYTLTIADVYNETMGDDEKSVISFEEEDFKPLVLNRTNATTISICLGTDETDEWRGQTVTIYRTKTQMQGKTVDCIRVDDRPSAAPARSAKPQAVQSAKPRAAAAPVRQVASDIIEDSDIPF